MKREHIRDSLISKLLLTLATYSFFLFKDISWSSLYMLFASILLTFHPSQKRVVRPFFIFHAVLKKQKNRLSTQRIILFLDKDWALFTYHKMSAKFGFLKVSDPAIQNKKNIFWYSIIHKYIKKA